MSSIHEHTLIKLPLANIKVDPANPNRMSGEQMRALRDSMKRFGYLTPVIVDQNMLIADGEHRYLVYKEMGYQEIPAYIMTFSSDAERRLLRQTMNKLHGQHDKQLDADEFLELVNASAVRNLDELASLIAQPSEHLEALLTRFHPEVELYGREELTEKEIEDIVPTTQLGDMWELGDHRLVCGDCTSATIMQRVCNESATIAQLNTDPPYGVDYASKNEMLNKLDKGNHIQIDIQGDRTDEIDLHNTMCYVFKNLEQYWATYNTFYIWSSGYNLHNIRMAISDCNLICGDYLVWIKNNHVLGRKDYNSQHEFCVYGWHNKHEFYGPHRTTLLEYDKPLVSALHPAMKPIELVRQTVTDGTKAGDAVLDCFAGAGSSLIVCEQTGRKWRGVELDPHYCDVIVHRWEKYTNQKATRITNDHI